MPGQGRSVQCVRCRSEWYITEERHTLHIVVRTRARAQQVGVDARVCASGESGQRHQEAGPGSGGRNAGGQHSGQYQGAKVGHQPSLLDLCSGQHRGLDRIEVRVADPRLEGATPIDLPLEDLSQLAPPRNRPPLPTPFSAPCSQPPFQERCPLNGPGLSYAAANCASRAPAYPHRTPSECPSLCS